MKHTKQQRSSQLAARSTLRNLLWAIHQENLIMMIISTRRTLCRHYLWLWCRCLGVVVVVVVGASSSCWQRQLQLQLQLERQLATQTSWSSRNAPKSQAHSFWPLDKPCAPCTHRKMGENGHV